MTNYSEYKQRRENLMAKIGNGTAIFRSAPMAVMHNDIEYSYRQDSDFFYLTGFNEPEAVAVIAPHHEKHKFILFVQPKDPEKETWSGYLTGVEVAKERYGADAAFSINELNQKLPQYLKKADKIYYRLGRDRNFNETVFKHWQNLMRVYPKYGIGPTAIQDSGTILHPMRLIKSDVELEQMQKAADIAVDAHNHAMRFAEVGKFEYQIQAEMEYIFSRHGATPAYPSIVASGANSCILHYIENNRQMRENDLLLIDAGAAYNYYNSDITRTFPISGKFTPEQRVIYELVLRAQLAAIEQVKPGNPYKQIHDTAVRVLVEGLMDLGMLKGNIDEIIEKEKYKHLYMHRTGHWLGLDVHDVGVYQWGEEPQNLQPGQVLTVEPGIYIGPNIKPVAGQPEVYDRWRGIGVRIEDDVLVTEEGCKVLTAGVPKSVEELER
ncbi:MAG: M24 family metallopeptidase [Okeania sp. SIO3I5]|uniref:aminopeptidase P N-terminal domain-containing protein n=1 Tax=Okeania sp. SIO3I5 TaxID=2607805 RepID=UPI0013B7FD4D|nr:aminopeptidase P N-terminal domain-containing protein [Okeania sp. SIO3I5]NEQ41902.1 M24 family metallopeptidase [Okeania sp. SIO3I5]